MMRRIFGLGIATLVGLGAFAPTVNAQISDGTQISPWCGLFASTPTFPWSDCRGSFAGNNEGNSPPTAAEVLAYVNTTWGPGLVSAGTTEEGSSAGPFGNWGTNQSTGTLTFDNTIFTDFVLALKAADSFSLYYFAASAAGYSSLQFSTVGVSNKNYQLHGLSHATLFVGRDVSVPEPRTSVLLALGFIGLAVLGRRRGHFIEA